MFETLKKDMRIYPMKSKLHTSTVAALVAVLIGAACGFIYASRGYSSGETKRDATLSEIIVSKDKGLLFKSEDGTPLLRIARDSWGTHFRLLSPDGKTLVELNSYRGTGGINVGSKNGSYAYVNAHDESATITLMGKYNKEAVEITSATIDGNGSLSLNEGSKGRPV